VRAAVFDWPDSFTFVSAAHPDGRSLPAAALARHAGVVRDRLRAAGVGPGDRLAVWMSDGPSLLATIYGAWAAGAAFSILPAFAGRAESDRARARVDAVLSVLRPRLLLASDGEALPPALDGAVETLALPAPDRRGGGCAPPAIAAPDDALAFVQFTSGSTGGAKGATIRFGQLRANLAAIAARIRLSREDRMVSWAPLYHDMGLMAVLLPLSAGAGLVLMETAHFVRRPTAWLEALSRHGGTLSTAPPSALKLATRRRARDIDLSAWRYAWIGGEAVFPAVVEAFEDVYAGAGLGRGVIQPTYGMAETVVGISCGHPGEAWRVRDGFISCGPPLDRVEMRIADAAGAALAEGATGRILVRGPSVMRGYLGEAPREDAAWFDTGDLGFLDGGQLHVTGRVKDVLKRGAESYPAALVEAIAEHALGLATGRCAAFAHRREEAGREDIVLLVEARDWRDDHAARVASAVATEAGLQLDVIRAAEGGRLPRTSSGKLMRQQAAALYREGRI
jgi:acyl-CoA synthetase (AMP-forming)/AMP-acid ligase II